MARGPQLRRGPHAPLPRPLWAPLLLLALVPAAGGFLVPRPGEQVGRRRGCGVVAVPSRILGYNRFAAIHTTAGCAPHHPRLTPRPAPLHTLQEPLPEPAASSSGRRLIEHATAAAAGAGGSVPPPTVELPPAAIVRLRALQEEVWRVPLDQQPVVLIIR